MYLISPTIRLGPLVSDFMAGLDLLAGFLTGAPLNLAIPSPEKEKCKLFT